MPSNKRRAAGRIRIVSGTLRGRRIPVADRDGLRPTPDRVRETLFNWLQARVPGARCLDLFAGTGALALEAASRGARRVVAVEKHRDAARRLAERVEAWQVSAVRVVRADALAWVRETDERFDLVFLDPPFHEALLLRAFEALVRSGCLAPDALVYAEQEADTPPAAVAGFEPGRTGRAGQVRFRLYRRTGE